VLFITIAYHGCLFCEWLWRCFVQKATAGCDCVFM